MNFTAEDVLARIERWSVHLRSYSIPITLSCVVKNSQNHDKTWCSIATVYYYDNIHKIEEPKWNIRLITDRDRLHFADVLKNACAMLEVQYMEPVWEDLMLGKHEINTHT